MSLKFCLYQGRLLFHWYSLPSHPALVKSIFLLSSRNYIGFYCTGQLESRLWSYILLSFSALHWMGCCSCVWFPIFLFPVSNSHRIVHRRDDRLRNSHTYTDCYNCQCGGQDLVVHICHILDDPYNYPCDGCIFNNCSNAMDWVWITQLSPLCSLLLSSPVF